MSYNVNNYQGVRIHIRIHHIGKIWVMIEYKRGLTEVGKKAIEEMVHADEEGETYINSLSPESPDGLPSKYHREATLRLGGGRVRVFKTSNGYFYEGNDTYISKENIAKYAPVLLWELRELA